MSVAGIILPFHTHHELLFFSMSSMFCGNRIATAKLEIAHELTKSVLDHFNSKEGVQTHFG